ncbi:MAG: hypothetical protein QF895_02875 [SAR86 cluster bacterium]|nr:hypothetical protein [SAR86 cluster bacterium]
MGSDKEKASLNKELRVLKQQLSKLEDEDGLCFWTGDGQEIDALYARIKEIENILNK